MCETREARIVGFNWRGKILDIRNFLPVILIIKYFIVTRPLPVAEEGSAQNWQKPNEGECVKHTKHELLVSTGWSKHGGFWIFRPTLIFILIDLLSYLRYNLF